MTPRCLAAMPIHVNLSAEISANGGHELAGTVVPTG